jgi:mono/diheme cytochrome c family protein
MHRIFKYLGYGLGGLVLLLVVLVGVVYGASSVKLHRNYQVAVRTVAIPAGEAAIVRGRHLAATRGCMECHGKDLGGNKVIDDPAVGRLYGPNLTRGRGGLPPEFADEDWLRAIRHGIAKDGHPLVLMPSLEFQHFSDDDIGNLIAYLKSVTPVDRARVPILVGPVARAMMVAGEIKLAAEHIDHVGLRPATVVPGVTVEYGHYLAVGCVGCHGENLSGGKIPGGAPDWPASRNLTPRGDLATWNEADFFQTLRTGTRPNGTKLSPVMPIAFGQMDDAELKALWLYLKSLPPAETGKH